MEGAKDRNEERDGGRVTRRNKKTKKTKIIMNPRKTKEIGKS